MNGTDHQMPQPWLGRVVAEANEIQDDYRFVVTSLAEYLPEQPTEGLGTVRGELRSGARANVLMGVASNRVDVHQACAVAERALERRAEPLSALLAPADGYPDALLGIAWQKLVENSAHDSSCACSDDEVVDQVMVRYREARQIGDVLAREAMRQLATEVDTPAGSTLVVNPTQARRGGVLSVSVPGEGPFHFVTSDGEPQPTQALGVLTGEGFSTIVAGQKVRWVLEMMNGPEFAGERIGHYDMTEADDGALELTFRGAQPGEPHIDYTAMESLPDDLFHFRAQWRRENPTSRDRNYTILETSGEGHFVGTALFMQARKPRGIELVRPRDDRLVEVGALALQDIPVVIHRHRLRNAALRPRHVSEPAHPDQIAPQQMAQRLVDRAEERAALAAALLLAQLIGHAVQILVLPAIVARHALHIGGIDHRVPPTGPAARGGAITPLQQFPAAARPWPARR